MAILTFLRLGRSKWLSLRVDTTRAHIGPIFQEPLGASDEATQTVGTQVPFFPSSLISSSSPQLLGIGPTPISLGYVPIMRRNNLDNGAEPISYERKQSCRVPFSFGFYASFCPCPKVKVHDFIVNYKPADTQSYSQYVHN